MKLNAQASPASSILNASLLAATLLAATAESAEAQQFSADLVAKKDETTTALGRLRVSDGKERLEAAALPDGFFLIDMAGPTAYFVRPGARVFMDAKQSSPLTGMFVPVDPIDPCRQWLAMAQLSAPTDPCDMALSTRSRGDGRRAKDGCLPGRGAPAPAFSAGSTASTSSRSRSRQRTAR